MNPENCKRKTQINAITQQTVPVGYKITRHLSAWLKVKDYSPKGILLEACKELGYDANTNNPTNNVASTPQATPSLPEPDFPRI